MSILSGLIKERKYKKLANGYKLTSQYTDSSTVNMPDGNTATTNLGAIKGLTASLNTTVPGYAADATAVANLNSNLGVLRFGIDVNGNYGYKKVGADTVIPFKGIERVLLGLSSYSDNTFVTSGWGSINTNEHNTISLVKNQYFHLKCDAGSSTMAFVTSNAIDITNYKKLNVLVNGTLGSAPLVVGISDDKTNTTTFIKNTTITASATETYYINVDLSSIIGSRYIKIKLSYNGRFELNIINVVLV